MWIRRNGKTTITRVSTTGVFGKAITLTDDEIALLLKTIPTGAPFDDIRIRLVQAHARS